MFAFGALIQLCGEEEHWCSCFDSSCHSGNCRYRHFIEVVRKLLWNVLVAGELLTCHFFFFPTGWRIGGWIWVAKDPCNINVSKAQWIQWTILFGIVLRIFFILKFWRTCLSSVTLISLHPRMQYEWLVVFLLWRKLFYYWLLLMENSSQFPSVEAVSRIGFDFRILWTK